MIVTLAWTTTEPGTLDVRSQFAACRRGSDSSWMVHARGVDLARGSKVYEREEDHDERVQCRINGGNWFDVGEVGKEDITLTIT